MMTTTAGIVKDTEKGTKSSVLSVHFQLNTAKSLTLILYLAQDMNHLGSQLKGTWLEDPQPRGSNNEGLYTLVSPYFVSKDNQIPGKEIMIKLVDIERRDAPCEVFALRKLKALQEKKGHVVSFVDSGWMKNWHQRIGVIVMHRSPGKPLFALDQWKQGDKVELLNFVRDGLKSIVWELVAELKYIHCDWRPENVLVDVIDPSTREIHIIDFGQPSIYQIKENRSPTPEEFTVWFNKQFDFLWKYSIDQALANLQNKAVKEMKKRV
ncbi:hypothetical protein J3R30DRAFT_1367308 [Lentinula aciculospora]|uniref:Protein kinase domain-containing protein n=1 Tax=Lentinula aciculospora TaxID=153920 RepID=A0A9W9DV23_9AGAR|nr:hypothetical protein J3R30DRAFT_1367308 [Lentinula aciculospora]